MRQRKQFWDLQWAVNWEDKYKDETQGLFVQDQLSANFPSSPRP